MGELNGGFKTMGVPPHELLIVKVPVEGGKVNVTFPDTLYKSFAQGVGFAEIAEIAQVGIHAPGAVYVCNVLQFEFVENVVVTVLELPFEGKFGKV